MLVKIDTPMFQSLKGLVVVEQAVSEAINHSSVSIPKGISGSGTSQSAQMDRSHRVSI